MRPLFENVCRAEGVADAGQLRRHRRRARRPSQRRTSRTAQLGHRLLDRGLALGRVEPLPFGSREHDVEDAALLGGELRLDQVGRPLRVGAGDRELVAQAAADGRDERDQDDDDPEPRPEDAPRVRRAHARPARERPGRHPFVRSEPHTFVPVRRLDVLAHEAAPSLMLSLSLWSVPPRIPAAVGVHSTVVRSRDGTGCRTISLRWTPEGRGTHRWPPARMLAAWTTQRDTALPARTAVVTGASHEIGAAMAEELAATWAQRSSIAHHGAPRLADAVVDRIRASGGRAIAVDGDLSRVADNRRLVEHTVRELGRLDVFVANAGLTRWAPFLDVDEETWDNVVDLNLKGSYFGAQAAARQMVAQGGGGQDRLLVLCDRHARDRERVGLRRHEGRAPAHGPRARPRARLRTGSPSTRSRSGRRSTSGTSRTTPATRSTGPACFPPAAPGRRATSPPRSPSSSQTDAAHVTGHTLTVDGGWSGIGRTP